MPTTPGTRNRLTSGLSRLLRTGRRLGVHAADALDGDLSDDGARRSPHRPGEP